MRRDGTVQIKKMSSATAWTGTMTSRLFVSLTSNCSKLLWQHLQKFCLRNSWMFGGQSASSCQRKRSTVKPKSINFWFGWHTGWVGSGREWVRNFCIQWVGSGYESEMADLRKIQAVCAYVTICRPYRVSTNKFVLWKPAVLPIVLITARQFVRWRFSWIWVGLDIWSTSSPGSGFVWVGSVKLVGSVELGRWK